MIDATSTPPRSHPTTHTLIDHTLLSSGVAYRQLQRLYQSLADGRKAWSRRDAGALRFRIELVCLLTAAVSPALRHSHVPLALRVIQIEIFCEMVGRAGMLALRETTPFISIALPGGLARLGSRSPIGGLLNLITRRKGELAQVAEHWSSGPRG